MNLYIFVYLFGCNSYQRKLWKSHTIISLNMSPKNTIIDWNLIDIMGETKFHGQIILENTRLNKMK